MKNAFYFAVFIMVLTGMTCVTPSSIAATPDCEEVYFSTDDLNHEHPLLKPHAEFMKSYKLAKAGDAKEQRNVAISYDTGYLVTACPEKAYYWYREAAQNGDQIAQDWLARFDNFKAIHDGPEFIVVNKASSPQALTKESNQDTAVSPSSTSSNMGKEATYKCKNVLDGSDYFSSKPCPQILGKSFVKDGR